MQIIQYLQFMIRIEIKNCRWKIIEHQLLGMCYWLLGVLCFLSFCYLDIENLPSKPIV